LSAGKKGHMTSFSIKIIRFSGLPHIFRPPPAHHRDK
jgi:hypothetical protein